PTSKTVEKLGTVVFVIDDDGNNLRELEFLLRKYFRGRLCFYRRRNSFCFTLRFAFLFRLFNIDGY
ncbi:hypothetical protein, partial [Treponema sp. R6D11]